MQDEAPKTSRPRKDYSRAARSLAIWAIIIVSGAYLAAWAWEQPFMAKPRMGWELSRMPPPDALSMPPKITAQQIRGFATASTKVVLGGGVGRMVDMAASNLRNMPR